nr:MAG TPA: programmed cell death activator [Caudoviricetes sp.]
MEDSILVLQATVGNLQRIVAAAIGEQAKLAAMCDVRDAQIKELQDEIEKLKKEAKK